MIHFPTIKLQSNFSFSEITYVSEEFKITHSFELEKASIDSPIIILNNNKVIGINLEKDINYIYKSGLLLSEPIIEYNKLIEKKVFQQDLTNSMKIRKVQEAKS